ncbi:hypothetical protein ACFQ0K_05025 [Nocardioides caeni]|uniref:DUF7847 domain-containing protein n=1 Tax=Nocardioides caeni TaxID=574700 RepID=A0A4S8N785_9ACTN|nr:hypothetical protein [Nocardioides caeni]THV12068.1 hypothetical protein E9934_11945 [Nocardioides caeni]
MTDGPTHYPPPGAPLPEEPEPPRAMTGGTRPPGPPAGGPPPPPTPWAPYAPQGGGGPAPQPGYLLGAAHKPGAFPLRPLTLGMIYDGAFRLIRFNPKATVGAAVLVTAVAMAIPIVITAVLTFTVGLAIDASGDVESEISTADAAGLVAAYGSLLLSIVLAQIGVIFVTGMVAHVARAAAVGRRMSLGEAWAATHGKRWRLLGLTLLINTVFLVLFVVYVVLWVLVVVVSPGPWPIVAWGLITVPAMICLSAWLWTRLYYLPVPPLMLEDVGVFGALGRSWTLTSRQFWRTFGIGLLTVIIGSIAGSMLSSPASFIGQIAAFALPEYAALLLVLTQAFALVVQNAFYAPFLAAVSSVQYLDLRMRKEAFDVELLREAGIVS